MTEDARDADKTRRRAEALRANLKRRKATRGGRSAPSVVEGEDARAFDPHSGDADKRGK